MSRTKPHVKIHLSVADHRKTSAVWADPKMRGMLVELWRKSGEKYAARRDNWVPLRPTDRMEIAGETDLSRADVAVKSLCSRLGYAVKRFSNRWEVEVRKFSKKQGYESKELQQYSSDEEKELQPPNPKQKQKPIPKQSEREPAARARPSGPGPLVNALANLEGDPDEKSAWLESEFPLIQAEAESDPKPGRIVPLTIRFYRQYLKGERKYRNWAAKQETRRRIAEHEAKFAGVIEEIEREDGYAAAHR